MPNDDTSTVTFASADDEKAEVTQKPREVLEALFAALPKRVNFSEIAGGKLPPKDATPKDVAFALPAEDARATVDEDQLDVHKKILKLAADEGIEYRDALVRVAQLESV